MADLLTLLDERIQTCSQCGRSAKVLLRTACKTCYNRAWKAGTVDQIPSKPKRVIVRDRKMCPRCQTVKLLDDFTVSRGRADGRSGWCRKCYAAHRAENFDRIRASERAKRYGITEGEYIELVAKQDGKCAICRKSCPQHGETLSVDHDHKTGEVRGLLCALCNRGVGLFADDPSLLIQAADYLRGR